MSIETVKCLAAQAEEQKLQQRLLELEVLGYEHRAAVAAAAERHPIATVVAGLVLLGVLPAVVNSLTSFIS